MLYKEGPFTFPLSTYIMIDNNRTHIQKKKKDATWVRYFLFYYIDNDEFMCVTLHVFKLQGRLCCWLVVLCTLYNVMGGEM